MIKTQTSNPELFDENMDFEEDTDIDQEEEITEPFDPTQIRVDTRPMTIDLVLDRIKYEEINLTPDFQRHADIWTDISKSRLIESILIRIPLPAFYLDATDDDKWLVIDGLQRLTAIKRFVIDNDLRLKGLEFLTNLKNKNYNELPRHYQRRIKETVITVYLIEKGTPPEVKFNIFKRINTGGLPLSLQEIRHALNQGQAANLLAKLADSAEFKLVTGLQKTKTRKYLRMEDRNFVLRFLAFMLTPYNNYQAKSLDVFLNETMSSINQMSQQEINLLEQNFIRAMKVAFDIFGEYAFRKRSKDKLTQKNPINKALFDAWAVNLSHLQEQQIYNLKERKEDLIDRFIDIMDNDKEFMGSISQGTDSITKVKYRFRIIEQLIQEVLL
ncbi:MULTISPECIES: DUF262 domain-containing protein [Nostocales]|uniref:GmrSD restriction endonucleases N-terminal domain-containing protein n=4 Tax=Nostocales TaxID=1161 RepID=A0A0C1QN62_9CYAN|nr:DUF262 domain-containing protein [Tolypothrix bouteillei]